MALIPISESGMDLRKFANSKSVTDEPTQASYGDFVPEL